MMVFLKCLITVGTAGKGLATSFQNQLPIFSNCQQLHLPVKMLLYHMYCLQSLFDLISTQICLSFQMVNDSIACVNASLPQGLF
jgi:hypothetical protein